MILMMMVLLMFPSLSSGLSVGPCGKVLVPASSHDRGLVFFFPQFTVVAALRAGAGDFASRP